MRAPTKWERFIDAVKPIRTAHAQALSSTSEAVKELAKSMRARLPEVNALKANGSVGEDNRGYLRLQEGADALSDADAKNAAQKVVAAENDDRKALYTAIAEENPKVESVDYAKPCRRHLRGRTAGPRKVRRNRATAAGGRPVREV